MSERECGYKWCIVPKCKSTSIQNPNKVFLSVPKEQKIRKIWINAVRRDPKDISAKTNCFVCEDHFDLENDMENYIRWKIVGGPKFIKKNVVPHRFDCQEDRKRTFSSVLRPTAVKRKRLEVIREIEEKLVVHQDSVYHADESTDEVVASTSSASSDKGIQVNIRPNHRAKYTQCDQYRQHLLDAACSPVQKQLIDVAISPLKDPEPMRAAKRELQFEEQGPSSNKSATDDAETSTSEYRLSDSLENTSASSEQEYEFETRKEEMSKIALQHTSYIILKNTRRYLGIPKECDFTIDLLAKHTSLSLTSIYLTLKKIRLSQTFAELGDDFGMSESTASRTFNVSILPISKVLGDLIVWPPADLIRKKLPMPFRARFSEVQAIVDCLEVEIQKPSDAIKQALTWSDYKKANTMKFLISSTPDGIINFISTGYGGRTSDALIVENCGFLDKLKPGAHIMADRGFKHIDKLIVSKQCKLVRPPSVETGLKMSEAQVIETKRIASLRIHIERVIRRLREFKILRPHSCLDLKLVPYIDAIIIAVCGIINTQSPLVKKM